MTSAALLVTGPDPGPGEAPEPRPADGSTWDEATLFVPEGYRPAGGVVDVVLHLHGAPPGDRAGAGRGEMAGRPDRVQPQGAIERLRRSHSPIGRCSLGSSTERSGRSGSEDSSTPPRSWAGSTVSSFSAGFGGVRELLKVPEHVERIDALILADSLYAGYEGDPSARKVDPGLMAGFAGLRRQGGRRARRRWS